MGRVVGTIDGELHRQAGVKFDGAMRGGERVERPTEVQLDIGQGNDFEHVKRSVRRKQ